MLVNPFMCFIPLFFFPAEKDEAYWLEQDEKYAPRPTLKKGDDDIYWVYLF